MKAPEAVLPGLGVRAGTCLFLVVLLLPLACVTLDKPAQVAECAAKNNCSDFWVPSGNKDAASSPTADGRTADTTSGPKEDLGSDGTTLADTVTDKADTSSGKFDVWGPEGGSGEVLLPADQRVSTDQPLDPGIDAIDAPGGDDLVKHDVLSEDIWKEDLLKEDVLKEDALREDALKLDALGPDTSSSNCTLFYGASPSSGAQGHPPGPGTSAEFCVATCDDIMGWNCSNFDSGRKVTVNGVVVNCGDSITKKDGYYVFRVSAGSNPTMKSAVIYWWTNNGWATSCAPPADGF